MTGRYSFRAWQDGKPRELVSVISPRPGMNLCLFYRDYKSDPDKFSCTWEAATVAPEDLEQATGMVDRNGNLIYEGDYIKVMTPMELPEGLKAEHPDVACKNPTGTVTWDCGGFVIAYKVDGNTYGRFLAFLDHRNLEVVGNTHMHANAATTPVTGNQEPKQGTLL